MSGAHGSAEVVAAPSKRPSQQLMPGGRPSLGSPEPGIPLLPAGATSPSPSQAYGELESSASAESPVPRSRARGRGLLAGLGLPLGGGRARQEGSSTLAGWVPLLAIFAAGLVGGWILPPLLSSTPSFSPTPPPPSPLPAVPEALEDTVLNPWTRPGVLRNRPFLSLDETSHMGISPKPEHRPWGVFNKVRWEPDPADQIHPDYGQGGESLMAQLADSSEDGAVPEGWKWAVNKTILGIGDSIMRNHVNFFSMHVSNDKIGRNMLELFSPDGTPWQPQQNMGVIHVPQINLKMANWFHMGLIEDEAPWFHPGENRPQRLEDKIKDIFLPTLNDPAGLDGRTPDLIIFESLSWDLVLLTQLAGAAGDRRYEGRPLDEAELDWLRGRQIEVLRELRETFPTSKIVVQTPHLGAKTPAHVFSPIRKYQQAEMVQSVALETGFELFDWGRIASPLSYEMSDGLHFVAGAATWIWGEMVLSYLRRAHFHPPNIPPAPIPNARRFSQQDLVDSYAQPKPQYPHPGGLEDG